MHTGGSVTLRKMGSAQQPAIRFLVESALRKVKSNRFENAPHTREEWVEALCEALLSASETSYQTVLASLMSSGVSSDEIFDSFVPAAARLLGEMWVQDRASFVEVTIGAGRLQGLYRARDAARSGDTVGRTIPLGQSFLMVIPEFEQHSLGAFVAADRLRRHGVWVHMGISLTSKELVEALGMRRFAAIGFSLSTWNTVEKLTEVIDYMKAELDHVPPVVVGGRAVSEPLEVVERTGADFAVRSAREAIERCGLSTIGTELDFERSE